MEDENRRLKRLVADLSLDNQMLKHLNTGNGSVRQGAHN
jgi:putative transposase